MESQTVAADFQNDLAVARDLESFFGVPPPPESEAPGAAATTAEGEAKEKQAPSTPERKPAQAEAATAPQPTSSSLRTFSSEAASAIYDEINAAKSSDQFDNAARRVWRGFNECAISEKDAEFLGEYINRVRPRSMNAPRVAQPVRGVTRMIGRAIPRQRARSPDRRASRDRRRTLGGSAVMPASLRSAYTEGQRAVLCVVAGEIKHHGICDLPIDKVAALAGVCRTTVQTTLHEARRLFHIKITERPQRGRKSLTNLVQIIDAEWLAWIKRAPTAHRPIGSNSVKMASTTKNTDLSKKGLSIKNEWCKRIPHNSHTLRC